MTNVNVVVVVVALTNHKTIPLHTFFSFVCFSHLSNTNVEQDPKFALTQYEKILQTHPTSAAAQYGKAKSLDLLADLNRSNDMLKLAINEYVKYIEFGPKINDTQFKVAAERCIERMRFIGNVIY